MKSGINEETRDMSYPEVPHVRKPVVKKKKPSMEAQQNKRTLIFVSKLLFLVGSLGLICVSALRFTIVDSETIHDVLMNFYYLFFGVVLVVA